MFRTIVLALTVASASAFVAPRAAAAPKTVVAAFENDFESGAAARTYGTWDPLNLLADADQERFDRLRYVEIKHGRICMLGVLGHIVTTAGIRLPGDIDYSGTSFASIGAGFAGATQVPVAGALQIFAFVGFLELCVMKDSANGAEPGEFPGDFRNGYIDFGWDSYSEEAKNFKRAIELNNGRAAQMGLLALLVHEQLDGNPYIINSLFGAPVAFN
jgi:hypothetical protein